MSVVAVSLTVTFDHEPGHLLQPEDLVLRVVEEAFEFTCGAGVASVVIDDVNLVRAVRPPSEGTAREMRERAE